MTSARVTGQALVIEAATVIGGLVLIVAAVLLPPPALIWRLVGCVFAPIVIGVVYGLACARRQRA